MQALHYLTQHASYNHYTASSPTSKMGWLDGNPSRATPPSRGTERSVVVWDMLQERILYQTFRPCESRHWPTIEDQSLVCILTDPGRYRVEVRLILGLERLYNRVTVPYCGLCPTPQSHEQSVLRFRLVTVRSYLGHLYFPQTQAHT
ncbi:hypothetical protein WA026_013849 [Henosepilachna vigintioctopunctata]|uniref:Uncharacterized protein n=1 Tax=Henosepilachna vigintioctopunctata TaxID=420089 RepID=A0AAW1UR63_9CUCU